LIFEAAQGLLDRMKVDQTAAPFPRGGVESGQFYKSDTISFEDFHEFPEALRLVLATAEHRVMGLLPEIHR
jgi:hypothetical protein